MLLVLYSSFCYFQLFLGKKTHVSLILSQLCEPFCWKLVFVMQCCSQILLVRIAWNILTWWLKKIIPTLLHSFTLNSADQIGTLGDSHLAFQNAFPIHYAFPIHIFSCVKKHGVIFVYHIWNRLTTSPPPPPKYLSNVYRCSVWLFLNHGLYLALFSWQQSVFKNQFIYNLLYTFKPPGLKSNEGFLMKTLMSIKTSI